MMMYIFVFLVICLVSDVSCARQKQSIDTRNDGPSSQLSVMPFEQIRYSVANVSNNYKSTTKFHHRGMGHLYFITHQFINLVLRGEIYPEGLLYLDEHKNIQLNDDIAAQWRVLLTHYGVMLCIAIAALLFIIIMPIAGLFFCCCRCAGRCGSRSQPFEKRYDPCRRHTIGFLLSGVTILIMFGVVCAFVTNEYLEEGAYSLPSNIRTSINDTQLYINNTKMEINNLLITNFNELDNTLNTILHDSGQIVKEKLGEISKAQVLSNLTAVVSGLSTIRKDLSSIDYLTKKLQEKAMELELALKDTRKSLLEKLHECRSQQACLDFLKTYNITNLSIESNFTQLPDVTASLNNVSALVENDIENEVLKGSKEFEKVRSSIQQSVDSNIPYIAQNIKKAGLAISDTAEKINNVLDKVQKILSEYTSEPIDTGEAYLKEYGDYRYYVGLGVSCTVLIVLSCLTFGLFCGYCGKRPDHGYNDDCCDKGTGANFLMLGVWVMFLTSAGLMAVTLIYFVTGIFAEFAVCRPLENPGDSRIFALIDEMVHLDNIYESRDRYSQPLNVSSVIRSCHRNATIYKVLRLEQQVNISQVKDYPSRYGILQKIEELTSDIRLDQHVDILTPNAKRQLQKLADSPLNNIDLTVYTNVLNEKITSIDLLQLSSAIRETADKLPQDLPEQKRVSASLRVIAQHTHTHQTNQVDSMIQLSNWLNGNATQLTEHLKFNQSSLRDAVNNMLVQIAEAQKSLNKDGPMIVGKLAREFGDEFMSHIRKYLDRVVMQTEYEVGKCYPLSLVYNATVVAGCSKILDPFNGFWASIGWILVLFIPAIVFSVKLASLYQKSDPYPGPLVEAEYLYDAYADRDNIPLANVHGKKKKGHRRYRHESYENSNGGPPAGAVAAAAADYSGHLGRTPADRSAANAGTHGDSRYSDIAPKHWDFPNGGPPRYHQSPPLSTEYERPPPYYYPGPAPECV